MAAMITELPVIAIRGPRRDSEGEMLKLSDFGRRPEGSSAIKRGRVIQRVANAERQMDTS